MKTKLNGSSFGASLLPRFLREDYSPYTCGVSANGVNYGVRARIVHLKNMVKTWVNTGRNPFRRPVECENCLFDTRVPNIYIGPNGLCNMCMTYQRNFDPAILAGELEDFLSERREPGCSVDAVVAFSGGKDSAASLLLARKKLGLNVVAVLVDNGFIPDAVIANGRRLCQRLETELVVLSIPLAPHLKKMIDKDFRNDYPCYKCTTMFHEEIRRYCVRHRINRVILGRNWWRWLEPEVRAVRHVTDEQTGLRMQFLSLPFALQLRKVDVTQMLEEEDWKPVAIHGNSTNCPIPGLVEHRVHKRVGYHPELNLLSREVIAGYLQKQEAKEELRETKDFGGRLLQLVEKKLREPGTRTAGTRPISGCHTPSEVRHQAATQVGRTS